MSNRSRREFDLTTTWRLRPARTAVFLMSSIALTLSACSTPTEPRSRGLQEEVEVRSQYSDLVFLDDSVPAHSVASDTVSTHNGPQVVWW